MTQTLLLLGDSILDNGPYTHPEPDTTAHLARLLAPQWTVERLAQDGATMRGLPLQLQALDYRPDVAVLSIGGNDLVPYINIIERPATSAAEVLAELLAIADGFHLQYDVAARSVMARAERTVLCTIYEVPLQPPVAGKLARVPLGLINDRIRWVGEELGLEVLELRRVCTEEEDFVLEIEPSAQGAEKIARAIAGVL
jgi:hypothetical protein